MHMNEFCCRFQKYIVRGLLATAMAVHSGLCKEQKNFEIQTHTRPFMYRLGAMFMLVYLSSYS